MGDSTGDFSDAEVEAERLLFAGEWNFVSAAGSLGYAFCAPQAARLVDRLGQRRVPATLVVDRQGHVTYVGGALDEPALAALRAALDAQVAAR